MKISVVTPSIRPDMLQIVRESLEKQTFRDFEWLPMLSKKGEKPDLCKQMNAALEMATGEIIVFLQDAIKIPADALECIARVHETKRTAITYPVGKTLDFDSAEWDWRMYCEKEIDFERYEIDFASIPRKLISEVRFDEAYDDGFGWENVQFSYELFLRNGVDFEVSRETHGVALDHDKLMKHPYKHKPNSAVWQIRKGMIEDMYGRGNGDSPLGSTPEPEEAATR